MPQKQTDNSNAEVKLNLRRAYLSKYGGSACLDCCQGDMKLWKVLRKEFPNIKYMGVDLKPKSGRHKVDSCRLLSLSPLEWDVVDIDTYGDPWAHYFALCKSITNPTTVFLTLGHGMRGMSNISQPIRKALGFPPKTPQRLAYLASRRYVTLVLHSCRQYDIIAHDIAHVEQSDTVEYFALRLTPKGTKS